MEKRINIFWKVIFIVLLIGLSLIPLYFMQEYVQSIIKEQNTLKNLASQSANYVSGLIESIQGDSAAKDVLNLKENYLLSENNLKSAPLTLGLAFLILLVVDIAQSSKLSLVNYFITGIGLILFYLIELVLARYVQFGFAYFVSAAICSLLLAIYLSGAIKSMVSGLIYGAALLAIYAFAFYLIAYIDDVIMYGAICLVAVFIVIIFTTRKIDWNQPTERVKGGVKKLN